MCESYLECHVWSTDIPILNIWLKTAFCPPRKNPFLAKYMAQVSSSFPSLLFNKDLNFSSHTCDPKHSPALMLPPNPRPLSFNITFPRRIFARGVDSPDGSYSQVTLHK